MYEPYDCQEECVLALTEARVRGSRSNLIVMATGLGKTAAVAFAIRKWRKKERGKVLYLCHQNDILEQARETFEEILDPDCSYGYLNGLGKEKDGVDFLFASFQTMQNLLHCFSKDHFLYVLVDESHHSYAETYKGVIEHFDPEYLLGFTATRDRLDEKDIGEIYGEVAYSLPLAEALARGLLCPVDYRLLTDEIRMQGIIDIPERKLSIKLLNKKIFVPKRDEEIISIIRAHASEIRDPRTIIFATSIAHCEQLGKSMEEAVAIHSKIDRSERRVRLELFRQGLVNTVVTVDAFNEGIDIPEANLIVFWRSTSSPTIFFQQLGRGLRRSINKANVRILDFVGNCERLQMVMKLAEEVKKESAKRPGPRAHIEPFHVDVDTVEFIERIVPALELLDRISANFYKNWQEAGESARRLGITTARQYKTAYVQDPKLPSFPYRFYPDFPGWKIFLDKKFYPTWEEAGQAARSLGIKHSNEYSKDKKYREDKRLPSAPDSYYADFPGWTEFFGKERKDFYPTWKEASDAALMLGITSSSTYEDIYKQDVRLPSSPPSHYSDFPGWIEFLGGKAKNLYKTCKEAREAARSLNIKNARQYKREYRKDPHLPADPRQSYEDFPGWKKFLRET